MNARDPKYNAQNTIDLEIEHPVYGWIPFTADPTDSEGADLYAQAIAGNFGPIADPQVIEAEPAVVYTSEEITALRQAAYQVESDPLFFKSQRGEATHQEWLDKVAKIKTRYPVVGE